MRVRVREFSGWCHSAIARVLVTTDCLRSEFVALVQGSATPRPSGNSAGLPKYTSWRTGFFATYNYSRSTSNIQGSPSQGADLARRCKWIGFVVGVPIHRSGLQMVHRS